MLSVLERIGEGCWQVSMVTEVAQVRCAADEAPLASAASSLALGSRAQHHSKRDVYLFLLSRCYHALPASRAYVPTSPNDCALQ
jgi:hypothetical protein